MAMIEVEPLMVRGKMEDGREVEVDVGLLLATDEGFRTLFARGLQQMLDTGFPADYSISTAIIFSEVFDNSDSTGIVVAAFPKNHFETFLREYIPGLPEE